MLTVGHTTIDAALDTYRRILAETTDSLAVSQGTIAALREDLATATKSLNETKAALVAAQALLPKDNEDLKKANAQAAREQADLAETLVGERPVPDPQLPEPALALGVDPK